MHPSMNETVAFYTPVVYTSGEKVTLFISGSNVYLVTVNGRAAAFGPSRAGLGYHRVDAVDVTAFLHAGENVLAIRVNYYGVNTYASLDVLPFLCAEVRVGEKTVAYTSLEGGGFSVCTVPERVKKVQRYSFQRAMVETYDLHPGAFAYETSAAPTPQNHPQAVLAAAGDLRFIAGEVPLAALTPRTPVRVLRRGSVRTEEEIFYDDRCLHPSPVFKAYAPEELTVDSNRAVSRLRFSVNETEQSTASSALLSLPADCFADLAFDRIRTGLFSMELSTDTEATLYVLYEETESDGGISAHRKGDCSGIFTVQLQAGTYTLTGSEPWCCGAVRLIALGGAITVKQFRLLEVACPEERIRTHYAGNDASMRAIWDAAVETFRQNTTDIFMDCPSRERGGWLCDSFFTARTEYVLTGECRTERAFLSNFCLADSFPGIPQGMLPMCYPADHPDGNFIPNWAMWFVLELGEYRTRSGDTALIAAAKERVYGLLQYLQAFENSDGLLERLPGWIFVEWSHANLLVQDVNYPTNMVYAQMKQVIGELYGDTDLIREAAALRKTIRTQSRQGLFFCDNAYRRDGALVLSGEQTEVCQYYAFFFGIASPKTDAPLWNTLLCDFGWNRKDTGKYPEIYPANAFIGNYLRLDLLARYGYRRELEDNIRGYFHAMAQKTGTLWENDSTVASLDHGFASHVACWIDALGYTERI